MTQANNPLLERLLAELCESAENDRQPICVNSARQGVAIALAERSPQQATDLARLRVADPDLLEEVRFALDEMTALSKDKMLLLEQAGYSKAALIELFTKIILALSAPIIGGEEGVVARLPKNGIVERANRFEGADPDTLVEIKVSDLRVAAMAVPFGEVIAQSIESLLPSSDRGKG